MLKLVLYLSPRTRRSTRCASGARRANPQIDTNLVPTQGRPRKSYRRVHERRASAKPRASSPSRRRPTASSRKRAQEAQARAGPGVPGLEDARREGEDQAVLADPKLNFPFYFPTVRVRGSSYAGTEPRIYRLLDERGKKHRRVPAGAARAGRSASSTASRA